MPTMEIRAAKDFGDGEKTERHRIVIEDDEYDVVGRHLHLGHRAARALIALLGNGFMVKSYDLAIEGYGFRSCRMTKMGGYGNGASIGFLGTFDPVEG